MGVSVRRPADRAVRTPRCRRLEMLSLPFGAALSRRWERTPADRISLELTGDLAAFKAAHLTLARSISPTSTRRGRLPRALFPTRRHPSASRQPGRNHRSSSWGRIREPETLAEARDAVGIHIDGVTRAQVDETRGIRSARGREQLGELAEERLEARRGDDLDDLARGIACVPERVPLIAGLENPRSRAGGHYLLAEQRSERPLDDEGVFVLVVMPVKRCYESPRCDRVMDDREAVTGLISLDLPCDTEPPKSIRSSLSAATAILCTCVVKVSSSYLVNSDVYRSRHPTSDDLSLSS